jgi:ribose 5-phosphate isomerase RpiB
MIRMRLIVAAMALTGLTCLLALGALRRRGLDLSDAREKVGKEVTRGKARVGIAIDSSGVGGASSGLAKPSGAPGTHDPDDTAVDQIDPATVEAAVP